MLLKRNRLVPRIDPSNVLRTLGVRTSRIALSLKQVHFSRPPLLFFLYTTTKPFVHTRSLSYYTVHHRAKDPSSPFLL